jgi:hypothetical protein
MPRHFRKSSESRSVSVPELRATVLWPPNVRAFVCIVECGIISAGAQRLRIGQPASSWQLRWLEDLCGMTLLGRDTHVRYG